MKAIRRASRRMRGHRGGQRLGEAFFSEWHRQYGSSAPMIDLDGMLYDGDRVVAVFDVKLIGVDVPDEGVTFGVTGGLPAMARMASDTGACAFVVQVCPAQMRFVFHALNARAAERIEQFHAWAQRDGRRVAEPVERDGRVTWECHEWGYWHFEAYLRARHRGKRQHDAAVVDANVDALRDRALPQPLWHSSIAYANEALRQRRAGADVGYSPQQLEVDTATRNAAQAAYDASRDDAAAVLQAAREQDRQAARAARAFRYGLAGAFRADRDR